VTTPPDLEQGGSAVDESAVDDQSIDVVTNRKVMVEGMPKPDAPADVGTEFVRKLCSTRPDFLLLEAQIICHTRR
jgi:hypothetical protein